MSCPPRSVPYPTTKSGTVPDLALRSYLQRPVVAFHPHSLWAFDCVEAPKVRRDDEL